MKNTKVKEQRVSFSLKKFMSLFLSLIMLMSVTAGVDFAAHAEWMPEGHYNGFGYVTIDDGTYGIIDYVGKPSITLEFPSKIKGKSVSRILYYFAHMNGGKGQFGDVKSVILPDSIKYIEDDTLCADCFTNLKDIYYTGTKADWKKVTIETSFGNNKEAIKKAKIHYNYTPVKLSNTSYTFNGKVRKPDVTVTGRKGKKINKKYYTVSYSKGRKNVGKYTVTVKLKKPYSSTVKRTFTIKPKSTSISKLTAGKKKFTVKWKKQSTQTTGYQIQYSTSSKFKTAKIVTVSKNKTTSKTIKDLKAKKKYYVRVRTYKTVKVNGKSTKIYSSWSKAKPVTTKK